MSKKRSEWVSYFRLILPLLIPVLIEQYFISAVSGVNTIMISRLGSEEISAIGSVGAVLNMIAALFISLSVGGTILAAQYLGRGQRQRLNQVAGLGLAISFILAVLVSLLIFIFRKTIIYRLFGDGDPQVLAHSLDYFSLVLFYYVPYAINTMAFGVLRGAGDVRTPMKISILMNLINMAANYLLVYGLRIPLGSSSIGWNGMGVRGSALALLIAQVCGMVIVLAVLFRGSRAVRLKLRTDFRFDKRIVSGIFRIGLPSGVEQIILNFGFLIIQTYIVTLPTAEIAAHSIVNSVVFLINAPALAIATITSTLIGQSVGEGELERTKTDIAHLQAFVAISHVASWLIFIPGARFFVGLYSQDQAAIAAAIPIIVTYLIFTSFTWGGAYQLPNGLRAAGDANFPSITSIACIILRVFMTYLLLMVFKLGVHAIWVVAYFDIALRAALYTSRRRGNRWLEHRLLD